MFFMFFFIFIRHIMISIHKANIYDHRACTTIIIIKKINFFYYKKMNGKNIDFNDKKIKRSSFYNNNKKYLIQMILMLIKQSLKKEQHDKYNSFKYFIGHNDNNVITPLCLKLLEMAGYINKFDENKIKMSLKVNDKQLLKITIKYGKKIERLRVQILTVDLLLVMMINT